MKLSIFAWNITSAYANGGAVFFRGLCRALARRSVEVTFFEQEAPSAHGCDYPVGSSVDVHEYSCRDELAQVVDRCADSDAILKFCGCGTLDRVVEELILARYAGSMPVISVDGDAPGNLPSILSDSGHFRRSTVPMFDAVLVCNGGPKACAQYEALGARWTGMLSAAVSPQTYRPLEPKEALACDVLFMGNRDPDRDTRVGEFFLRAAVLRPAKRFVLAGAGWSDAALPSNVQYIGHIEPRDHRATYCGARLVLNVTRQTMLAYGFCPSSRLMEAAACGACVITDAWPGLDSFFTPGNEVLVAKSPDDVVAYVDMIGRETARRIGAAARERVLAHHTCDMRAAQLLRLINQSADSRRHSSTA